MGTTHFETIIIGGGIAGASLAYFLTERGLNDILLIEREAQCGYHATGRSAATLVEWDVVPPMQALKARGAAFLRSPSPGFTEHSLVDQVGVLILFQEPRWRTAPGLADAMRAQGTTIEIPSLDTVNSRVPVLADTQYDGAVWLPEGGHIDVHELLSSYLRHAAQRGAQRRCGLEALGIRVVDGRCRAVQTSAGEFTARWIVNAAGAWAQTVASLAGATPIAFTPYRRHIVTFAAPPNLDIRRWPLVQHESQGLYFKPESGGFLASPMDEFAMAPCDAHTDDTIVAEAVEKIARIAPAIAPTALRRTWAGLRTFAPDRVCVVGEDPRVRGFFWLAGQGGCGIETSPAFGQFAADLLIDGRITGLDTAPYLPNRFA